MPSGSGSGASLAHCKQHLRLSVPIWQQLTLAASVATPALPAGFNPAVLDRVKHRLTLGRACPWSFASVALCSPCQLQTWVQLGVTGSWECGTLGACGMCRARHILKPLTL